MNRWVALALAWLATAVGSGFLAAWLLREPPREVVVERIVEAGRNDAGPTLAGRETAQGTAGGGGAPPAGPDASLGVRSPTDGDATSRALESMTGEAGWIEVRVLNADGSPSYSAQAYAVRSGTPAPTDGEEPPWPMSETDERGAARIPVPAAGAYDVGAVSGFAYGMATDVQVADGRTTRTDVQLGPLAPVRVEISQAESTARYTVNAASVQEPGAQPSYRPVRGQARSMSGGHIMFGGGRSIDLPAGVPFALSMTATDPKGQPLPGLWEAVPRVVKPPGSVVFRPSSRVPVKVAFKFALDAPASRSRRPPTFRAVWAEGSPDLARIEGSLSWQGNSASHWILNMTVGPEPQRLSWSGDAVVPGERTLSIAELGSSREVAVEVEVRASDLPTGPDGIDFEGGPDPPPADAPPYGFAWGPGADEPEGWTSDPEHPDDIPFKAGRKALFAWGSWRASDVVLVPSRGRMRVQLHPAGYLLVSMTRMPAEGLGRLAITRADGVPLAGRSAESLRTVTSEWQSVESLSPGTLLGPLPQGDVDLVVTLGGMERSRVVGHVRANRITPVEITW